MFGDSPYNCPECDGEGIVDCQECGSEYDCPECGGCGWDPEQVDIKAFMGDAESLNQKMRDDKCIALTRELYDGETRIGRTGGKYGKVVVTDYLLEG